MIHKKRTCFWNSHENHGLVLSNLQYLYEASLVVIHMRPLKNPAQLQMLRSPLFHFFDVTLHGNITIAHQHTYRTWMMGMILTVQEHLMPINTTIVNLCTNSKKMQLIRIQGNTAGRLWLLINDDSIFWYPDIREPMLWTVRYDTVRSTARYSYCTVSSVVDIKMSPSQRLN